MAQPPRELVSLKIIWGALLASQVLYIFVASTKSRGAPITFDVASFTPQNSMEMAMSVLALVMVGLAFLISGFLFNRAGKNLTQTAPLDLVIKSYFVPFIIRLALLESCTLYGFVMAFLRGSMPIMLPFVAISVIGFLLSFPSEVSVRKNLIGPERI